MLPTSRSVSQIEDARTNGDAGSRISAAAKNDSSPAFVACFVLPAQQAGTLISVLQEFVSTLRVCLRRPFTLGNRPNQ
jgi:hypothetical protein